MNPLITDDLIQEATELLEKWARKKNLLPKGSQLLVSMSITDSQPVIFKMEDKRSSTQLDELLAQPIEKLGLTYRPRTRIEAGNIYFIGDLVRKTESDLLKLPNFGKKSMYDVKSKLENIDLKLNMDIPVGPRELEAVMNCPVNPYIPLRTIQPFKAAGIWFVKDLLPKTEEQIISILKDCDPKEIGEPKWAYHLMRQSLTERGLIP